MSARSLLPTGAVPMLRCIESEFVVLGAVVGDGVSPGHVDLEPGDFTGRRHADLWVVLQERESEGEPIDAATLYRELEDRELADLVREATTASGLAFRHVLNHRNRLRRLTRRREIAEACAALVECVEQPGAEFDRHIQKVRAAVCRDDEASRS